ncbi:hypothetical protein [Nonomuraea salmonea]|uniref:hypothetical protein n=1 Tax=Nonomuraea salmonea TaxID=46181 RepID=UPI0031EF0F3D
MALLVALLVALLMAGRFLLAPHLTHPAVRTWAPQRLPRHAHRPGGTRRRAWRCRSAV